MHPIETFVLLFTVVVALVSIARRFGIPYPILLVLQGMMLPSLLRWLGLADPDAAQREAYMAVELPYGGEAFAMTIVVPREERTLEDVVSGMDAAAWRDLVSRLETDRVGVALPRFRLEYEKTLNDVLKSLGMEIPFQGGFADFSKINRELGRISTSTRSSTRRSSRSTRRGPKPRERRAWGSGSSRCRRRSSATARFSS